MNKQYPVPQASTPGSGGGGGAVSSVFGRTGAVTATAGDYTLDLIGALAANLSWNQGSNTWTMDWGLAAASLETAWDASGNLALQLKSPSTVAGVTNSPKFTFGGSYEVSSGPNVFAADTWSLQLVPSSGVNGNSVLTLTHSGSTGAPQVLLPHYTTAPAGGTPLLGFSGFGFAAGIGQHTSNQLDLYGSTIGIYDSTGTERGQFQGTSNYFALFTQAINTPLLLSSNYTTGTTHSGLSLTSGGGNNLNATSGNYVSVNIGGEAAGIGAIDNFDPTSGTATFTSLMAQPTINQTGGANGTVRVLAAYPKNTAVGGVEYLLALGTTSAVGNSGTLTDLFALTSAGHFRTWSTDMAATVTITASATTASVSFGANYLGTNAPVVTVTPTSDPTLAGGVWVTYSGSAGAWTGFTIHISAALAADITFNYTVIGVA